MNEQQFTGGFMVVRKSDGVPVSRHVAYAIAELCARKANDDGDDVEVRPYSSAYWAEKLETGVELMVTEKMTRAQKPIVRRLIQAGVAADRIVVTTHAVLMRDQLGYITTGVNAASVVAIEEQYTLARIGAKANARIAAEKGGK